MGAMRDQRRQEWRDAIAVYAAVALGSMVGGVLRFLASSASLSLWGPGFPVGTLIVNVVGSFVIGFYATLTGPDGRVFASPQQRLLVMAGFCGGLTTFSTFSLETFMLMRSGKLLVAVANIGVSVVTWLAAVWLGHMLAMRLNRLKRTQP